MVEGHRVLLVIYGGVHNDWNHSSVEAGREGDRVNVEDQYRPGIGDIVDDGGDHGGNGVLAEIGGGGGEWEGEVGISESGGRVEVEGEGVSGRDDEESKEE